VFAAAAAHAARRGAAPAFWPRLDTELDARTPSLAQRESSRSQGAGTLRALRAQPSRSHVPPSGSRVPPSGSRVPSSGSHGLPAGLPDRPHHAVVLGAAVGFAGGPPIDAALSAAYLSVSGPASAAVRLLGLDPFLVNAAVLALDGELRAVAERAAAVAALDPADLPAPGAPGLDLLAESHRRQHEKEVRLFAS